ncbi:MAG: hypothetical protein ABIT01_12610 [Thermoanaerobaculia bacterium]
MPGKTTTSATIAARPTAAKPAATAASTRTIVGEIVSIDAVKGLVVVGRHGTAAHESTPAKPGESVTVTLDGGTQILKGKRPASVAELKAKDHAVVRYQLTPKGARALSVRVADLVVGTPAPLPSAVPAAAAAGVPAPAAGSPPTAVTGGAGDK